MSLRKVNEKCPTYTKRVHIQTAAIWGHSVKLLTVLVFDFAFATRSLLRVRRDGYSN